MKWKHKSWITVWLILVCAALLVTGTYAAYTKVEYVKRVVASKDGSETVLFSSNYLYRRDKESAEYPLRMIPVGTQSAASVTVTVCNYLQSDLTKANEEDILYTLTATLVDVDGKSILEKTFSYQDENGTQTISGLELAKQIQINDIGFNGGVYTSRGTLTGGAADADLYTITCPQEYISILSEVGIQMCAQSDGISKKLVAQLWLGSGNQQPTQWQGRFDDITSLVDNAPTTAYHAFNYTISGTMEQTLRLSWDPKKITLGKWSREELGIADNVEPTSDTTTGMVYYDIQVGGEGQPTSYTLQFYRVGGIPENETAGDVRGYVSYAKVEQTGNQS